MDDTTIVNSKILKDYLSEPEETDNKYRRGVVAIIAGSQKYKGAGILTTKASLYSGAGYVKFFDFEQIGDFILNSCPEIVIEQSWDYQSSMNIDSLIIGPGLDLGASYFGFNVIDQEMENFSSDVIAKTKLDARSKKKLEEIYEQYCLQAKKLMSILRDLKKQNLPVVIDAGAIDFLVLENVPENFVITPHIGELSNLLKRRGIIADYNEISKDPIKWAKTANKEFGATVLLKGYETYIVNSTYTLESVAPSTNLAMAGHGDVLSGIIGTLLAQNINYIKPVPSITAEVVASANVLRNEAIYNMNQAGPIIPSSLIKTIPFTISEYFDPEE